MKIFTFLYEFPLFRFLDTATILNISQVCRCWRDLVRSCFVWRFVARRSGIILLKICPDTPTSCSCQTEVRKQLRWRRNFRNGKYRKLFVPFLKRNFNEEMERFTSCLDFDSRRLVFGSQEGSLMLWKPSVNKKENYCKKYRLSDKRIDFVHIYEDHVSIIEGGNLNIYLIGENNELILEHSFNTGEHTEQSRDMVET